MKCLHYVQLKTYFLTLPLRDCRHCRDIYKFKFYFFKFYFFKFLIGFYILSVYCCPAPAVLFVCVSGALQIRTL
jgi:hypothetical protein